MRAEGRGARRVDNRRPRRGGGRLGAWRRRRPARPRVDEDAGDHCDRNRDREQRLNERGGGDGGVADAGRACALADDFFPIVAIILPAPRAAFSVFVCCRPIALHCCPTHPSAQPSNSTRAYLAWVAVCLIWGTTYLGIRIALETIPPLHGGDPWIVAGSLLIAVLKVRGEPMPGRREWPALTLLGILLLGFGNGAVVWGN